MDISLFFTIYLSCFLCVWTKIMNTVFHLIVGQDGNFFVYSYMSQKDVDAEVLKAKIPSAVKLKEDERLPDDIDDPNAYR